MFRSWRQSVRELGERVERLEGELGRLNMENADLKSQLKERDARIAKLESVLEESRRAGKRQAAPFSKDKPKRDPKKPGRKPGSKYGRQAVRAIPVPDKTFEAPCPEQCPCGGKVGAEGSIDLYQVDIPPIQPETWKFGCLRCLLLVMCTYPFAKTALTLHLARGEGCESYFGCNLMQRKVLASSHQHLIAEAPGRDVGSMHGGPSDA